jgi:hypothetical protein
MQSKYRLKPLYATISPIVSPAHPPHIDPAFTLSYYEIYFTLQLSPDNQRSNTAIRQTQTYQVFNLKVSLYNRHIDKKFPVDTA